METKVISPFTDRENGRIYLVGDKFSGSAARISELAEKGHVEEKKASPTPPAKKQAKN